MLLLMLNIFFKRRGNHIITTLKGLYNFFVITHTQRHTHTHRVGKEKAGSGERGGGRGKDRQTHTLTTDNLLIIISQCKTYY